MNEREREATKCEEKIKPVTQAAGVGAFVLRVAVGGYY